jgi:protoheme IX farnesyltransferase
MSNKTKTSTPTNTTSTKPGGGRFGAYYRLTKPGIVYGNALMAMAGYIFGAAGISDVSRCICMLVGVCLVMASACVFNNVLDRRIDAQMGRTKQREVVIGLIGVRAALVYGTVLLVVGTALLGFGTNVLATSTALFGWVAYVAVYGYAKRHTHHSTLVGTISGATPPVIGYVAATGTFDSAAAVLFLLLVTWQMPHFYAIAIFRRDDYAAAGLPVLSVTHGVAACRRQIIAYAASFVVVCVLLGWLTQASWLTAVVIACAGLYWLWLCLQPMKNPAKWARRQFKWSLLTLLIMSMTVSVDGILR